MENKSTATIAHAVPCYTRYGIRGFNCYAVGYPSFYAKTIRIAKEWASKFGLDIIKL